MIAIKTTLGLFLVLVLMGCEPISKQEPVDSKVSRQEIEQFVKAIKGNLVFVEGGEFLMGDFGSKYGAERLPYDFDADSKPLHNVRLSSFSINKFKITNQEFQLYLKFNGLTLRSVSRGSQEDWENISSAPNLPAHMDWYEAEKYCNWLAEVTALPFSLPTEAQWEYAARSRGQYLMVATDDGTYKITNDAFTRDWKGGPKGINISSSGDREAFAEERGWKTRYLTPLPVDRFPPNPLGLYAMSDNGLEWVKDWYDPDYYKTSPVDNPQGPDKPVGKDYFGRDVKVMRGQSFANPRWGGGVNVHRTFAEPHGYNKKNSNYVFLNSSTARCVANSVTAIK